MKTSSYSGFYKLTPAQRQAEVAEFAGLSNDDLTSSAMYILGEKADELYEISTVGSTDWRYTTLTVPSVNNVRLPIKYYQDATTGKAYKNLIPLIRLPELYYIAAEVHASGPAPDLNRAMELLNTVRASRGVLAALSGLSAEEIMEQITLEYRKEFISEGQMFLYYKRKGFQTIPNSITEMKDEQYVLPFPEIDENNGIVQ